MPCLQRAMYSGKTGRWLRCQWERGVLCYHQASFRKLRGKEGHGKGGGTRWKGKNSRNRKFGFLKQNSSLANRRGDRTRNIYFHRRNRWKGEKGIYDMGTPQVNREKHSQRKHGGENRGRVGGGNKKNALTCERGGNRNAGRRDGMMFPSIHSLLFIVDF